MDPLTALGLVSNVVQLLDIVGRVGIDSYQLAKSADDSLPANQELKQLAEEYYATATRVSKSCAKLDHATATEAEVAVERLAKRYQDRAGKLISMLLDLEVTSPNGKKSVRKVVMHVVRSRWQRKDLETAHQKLRDVEQQLSTALIQLTRSDQRTIYSEINKSIKRRGSADTVAFEEARSDILAAIEELKSFHGPDRQRVRNVMNSLWFEDLEQRRELVPDAHEGTFDWTLAKDPMSSLGKWLLTGSDIYWVRGKAGAGKSTLMKFVRSDARTTDYLKQWANSRSLVIVEHFFFYAGSQLQRSHTGLLRTLLWSILRAAPKLMEHVCPERWSGERDAYASWNRTEISNALQRLREHPDMCFCFFIDGLDEYHPHDEHYHLLEDLRTLAALDNVKLCVSSRPWSIFERAFGTGASTMVLEDLTRGDLTRFVTERLRDAAANRRRGSQTLQDAESEEAIQLITEIVSKSKGVFLWVHLIVARLSERVTIGQSVGELREFLETFPEELEEYFTMLIYGRINPTWKNETAAALKLASVMMVFEQDKVDDPGKRSFLNFWLLTQGLQRPDFVQTQKITHCTNTQLYDMLDQTIAFLDACCRDLIHVQLSGKLLKGHGTYNDLCIKAIADQGVGAFRVSFMHRTVFDFLEAPKMQTLLTESAPPHFNDPLFPFSLAVARMKVIPRRIDCAHYQTNVVTALRSVKRRPSIFLADNAMQLARELDRACSGFLAWVTHEDRTDQISDFLKYGDNLLPLLVVHQHYQYATAALSEQLGRNLLCKILRCALGFDTLRTFPLHEVDLPFVEKLLKLGADPNLSLKPDIQPSIWQHFLRSWVKGEPDLLKEEKPTEDIADYPSFKAWKIADLLIKAGADCDVRTAPASDFTGRAFLESCVPHYLKPWLHRMLYARQYREDYLRSQIRAACSAQLADNSTNEPKTPEEPQTSPKTMPVPSNQLKRIDSAPQTQTLTPLTIPSAGIFAPPTPPPSP